MARYLTTVTVPVAIDTTFAYVSDFSHAGSWDPRVSAARRLDDGGPVGLGSRFELDSPGPLGGTIAFPYRVVRFDAPHHVAFEGQVDFASYRDALTFEADGDAATRLTYDARFELRGLLRLGSPIMSLFFQRIGDDATNGIPDAVARAARG